MLISSDPLVSVVLPTYNRARVLARAIGSVLAQTHTNLELIVADDGSTDDTEAVVRSIKDPRLHYHRCPRNGGAGYARNRGIERTRGELIAFQDSDDEWVANKLERQIQALRTIPEDVGMLACAYKKLELDGQITYFRPDAACAAGDCERRLLSGFDFITPTWLLRRECLTDAGWFDEQLPNREDWELVFHILPRWRCQVLDEILVNKYETAGSLEDNWPARIVSWRALLQRHGPRWAQAPELKATLYYQLARAHARMNQDTEARLALAQSMQLRPLRWRSIRLWLLLHLGVSRYNNLVNAKIRISQFLRRS